MATAKVVVAGSDVTASQLKDLMRQIEDHSLTGDHFQALLEHRNPFEVKLDRASQLQGWKILLAELFGTELDTDSLVIPEQKPGFDRLIVVPKGLTFSQIIQVCRQKFENVYIHTEDLDAGVTENDRTSKETYAIWVRERVEADEENKNFSANQLKEQNHRGITLMERLLLELKYFAETGKHLDVQNITLCSGSRYSDGDVPYADWYPGDRRFCIGRTHPDYRSDCLRSRSAVSV